MINNDLDRAVKNYEKVFNLLKQAETTLTQCKELCHSYFKYGQRNEANNMRYNAMVKMIDEYFANKKEAKDEIRRLQSKSD